MRNKIKITGIVFLIFLVKCIHAQTLMINEVSQGVVGAEEYIELVVVGEPSCDQDACVDLRGWYIDDNSGYFAGGSGTGIATGCARFVNSIVWSCIPVGSIILIYNNDDYNSSIIPANDEYDSNHDCVYVLPINSNLIERHPDLPSGTVYTFPTTGFVNGGVWTVVGMKNGDDSFQVLDPADLSQPVHSVSWGNNVNNTVIYFPTDMSGLTASFLNILDNDYANQDNWVAEDAGATQTPGTPNSAENALWISSMNHNCAPIIPPVAEAGPETELSCGAVSATLDGTGSTGNGLIYSWNGPGIISGGSSAQPEVNLPGTYSLTITDVNGCTSIDDVEVVQTSGGVSVQMSPNTEICTGESTVISASGGISYSWDNGLGTGNTHTVSPTITTIYSVTVTDSEGCTGTGSMTVLVHNLPNADAGPAQNLCYGAGTILSASGGTQYLWESGATDAAISVSPSASSYYSVIVTDIYGCSKTDSVLVNVFPQVTASATSTLPEICVGQSTILSANGGTSFIWSNGSTNQSILVSPVSSTFYYVTVFDANGCNDSIGVYIAVEDSVSVTLNPSDICQGESTLLTASGGDTYLWSNGESTQSITVSPMSTTTYSVTVSNEICSGTTSATVGVSTMPSAGAGSDFSICNGESAVISAAPGYTYIWDNGKTSDSFSDSPAFSTIYFVTITNGACSLTDDLFVTVKPLPNANAGADEFICEGQSTVLTASGGTSYVWETGQTTQSINVSPASSQYFEVTVEENNCFASDSVYVEIQALPVAEAGSSLQICFGEQAQLSATGGSLYHWSTGAYGSSITVQPASTTLYFVTVTENSCSVTDSVQISVSPQINIVLNSTFPELCQNQTTSITASGGLYYLWSTGETTSTIDVSPTVPTTYSVTVSNDACSESDSTSIVVHDGITIISSPSIICQGESSTLMVSSGDTYEWSTGATTQSVTVTPPVTTTYHVTVSNSICTDSTDITVFVSGYPDANAGNDTAICAGESLTLIASGGETYVWSTNQVGQSILINPSASNYYVVTVANEYNCASADSIYVNVVQLPNAFVGNDMTICEGDTIQLLGYGGTTCLWSPSSGLSNPSSFTPYAYPSSTTTYTLTVFDDYFCSNTDNITIKVNPKIILNLDIDVQPGVELCFGDQASFVAEINNVTSQMNFNWSVNNIHTGSNSPYYFSSTIRNNDIIYCQVTSDEACVVNSPVIDSVLMIVHYIPEVLFDADKLRGCEPLTVHFEAGTNYDYLWEFDGPGGIISSTELNPEIVFSHPGSYDLHIIAEDNFGCQGSMYFDSIVNVYANPNAEFYAEVDVSDAFHHKVHFLNASSGGYMDYWTFGDGSNLPSYSPNNVFHTYDAGGIYSVVLKVTSINGCIDTYTADVQINDIFTIYVPSAIVLSADNENSYFKAYGTGISNDGFRLAVYDRWGELIFESTDKDEAWDGRVKGRRKAPVGVYAWSLNFKDSSTGKAKEKFGSVTVIK